MTQKVTARGQITLRKDLLQHLGIEPGGSIEFEKRPDGSIAVRAVRRTGSIRDIFGILAGKSKVKLTIDEINEAAADGWAGKL